MCKKIGVFLNDCVYLQVILDSSVYVFLTVTKDRKIVFLLFWPFFPGLKYNFKIFCVSKGYVFGTSLHYFLTLFMLWPHTL